MRIAIVSPPWLPVPPMGYGGIEVVLDGLCRGLDALGHDVLLFATGDSTCTVETEWTHERHVGVEFQNPASELRHVVAAYERIRTWGADIIHDHTYTGPFYSERFDDVTVVTTNHGPFERDFAAVYRALRGRIPVLAISHYQADTAHTPIEAVIHHGIDVGRIAEGKGDGGYALFLGRMCEEKGVHIAIRAAQAAGVPLRLAAKMRQPEEHRYFENHVAPLLGPDVDYVGEVGGETKQQLLRNAICLLNPVAWGEPFGMVMIEALACGTPVIATPLGAAPEIIDDGVTGYLRSDAESLAAALGKIDRIDRTACRIVAEERFSIERMASEHAAVYERIASR